MPAQLQRLVDDYRRHAEEPLDRLALMTPRTDGSDYYRALLEAVDAGKARGLRAPAQAVADRLGRSINTINAHLRKARDLTAKDSPNGDH